MSDARLNRVLSLLLPFRRRNRRNQQDKIPQSRTDSLTPAPRAQSPEVGHGARASDAMDAVPLSPAEPSTGIPNAAEGSGPPVLSDRPSDAPPDCPPAPPPTPSERRRPVASDAMPLTWLDLRARTFHALSRAGIYTVAQLAALDRDDLLSIRGIGEKGVADVARALERCSPGNALPSTATDAEQTLSTTVADSHAPLEALDLSPGLVQRLRERQVLTVGCLAQMSRQEFLAMDGVGPIALAETLAALSTIQRPLRAPHDALSPASEIPHGPALSASGKTPLAALGLSARCHNALERAGVRTVERALCLSPEEILKVRNIGALSLQELLDKRAEWTRMSGDEQHRRLAEHTGRPESPTLAETSSLAATASARSRPTHTPHRTDPGPDTFERWIDMWLHSLDERSRDAVSSLYGLYGKSKTLEEIGALYGVTRERIRQIVTASLRKVRLGRRRSLVSPYIDSAIRLVEQMGGLLSSDELLAELPLAMPLGAIDPLAAARLLCAISQDLVWLRGERALVLAGMPHRQVRSIRAELRQFIPTDGRSLPALDVVAQYVNAHLFDSDHRLDEAFVQACLRTDSSIESEEGCVRLQPRRATRRDRVVAALRSIGEPAHTSLITSMMNRSQAEEDRVSKRIVHACLTSYRDTFVRVGRGVYGLAEWDLPDDGSVANAVCRVLATRDAPMPFDEIAASVLATWRVAESTIRVALSQDERVERIGQDLYALRN